MRYIFFILSGVFVLLSANPDAALAGKIYQNFEPELGVPVNIWNRTLEGPEHVGVVDRHQGVHLGRYSAWYESGWNWNGLGINRDLFDFRQKNNDRFTFWVLAFPSVTCQQWGCNKEVDNNIGVNLHDNGQYGNGGHTVWTVPKARYKQWTKLEVLFSQLPPDFDLNHISQIQFINFWPGKYYFDDFHAVREDRVYQSFNRETRSESTEGDYGWKWNENDTAGFSAAGEPVHDGEHSWKMTLNGYWGGGGIQSQQQTYYVDPVTKISEQSFWHNNFLPAQNDRLSLWVYALPQNGMDNNLNVQIYDHGLHSNDKTKAESWNKIASRYGNWTRLEVLFKDLPKDLDLSDIDKIQIQNFWPGTYYIDDIRATGPHPVIHVADLANGVVRWDPVPGAENYRLQQSFRGPEGPWTTIASTDKTFVQYPGLSRAWLRVRWEEKFADKSAVPYFSPWSDPVEYNAPSVQFNFKTLQTGYLSFNAIPQASVYEVQTARGPAGPWGLLYKGPALTVPLKASFGVWYRVRAIQVNPLALKDYGDWSRPQMFCPPGKNFVKASGRVLKDRDGTGNELVLSGYNLGNVLLTEDWMTGFGFADDPAIADDWTIRDTLTGRFGPSKREEFFRVFQKAYLNTFDFDLLARQNVTQVRLPVFYRNLMDDNGNFILNREGKTDFYQIDRIVDAMADRGIYILIDLHGAPGSQSPESHTGRKGFNKLFENSPDGELFRTRTEKLWKEIAIHYKDNPWVLGYDLLNEPTGAPSPLVLADMYDRLYKTIRAVDNNHLIVMEGIWDWDSLPNPLDRKWQNVMYQFHYYCPMISEPKTDKDPVPVPGQSCADYGTMDFRFSFQKAFIDKKVADSLQPVYQVPAMIGEFSAHDDKKSWDYYIQTFNAQQWNWTVWAYKDHSSPSNWGILNHAYYNDDLPKFRAFEADGKPGDSWDVLIAKASKYASQDYHVLNATLSDLVKSQSPFPLYQTSRPEIFSLLPRQAEPGSVVTVTGRNFGVVQGNGQVTLGSYHLSVVNWSDKQIEAKLPANILPGSWSLAITTAAGYANPVELVVLEPSTVEISGVTPNPDGTFVLKGQKMCDTPGTVEFTPNICVDDPPGSAACNKGDAAITNWTESQIKGYAPPDYAPAPNGTAKIHCNYGGPLYPTMIPENRPPVLAPIPNRAVIAGTPVILVISATDPDGDVLKYSAQNLPPGAIMFGQIFFWVPPKNIKGTYNVTFKVTDGSLSDQKTVTITVMKVPVILSP